MRNSLEKLCENFITNRDTIKNTFKWDSQYMIPVCAAELCKKQTTIDGNRLKECRDIIDHKTGIFSNFKGNVKLPIITLLAAEENPEQKFADAMEIYEVLKKHFSGSEYLALIATILTNMIHVSDTEKYAVRGKNIYTLMKKEHPFLTSSEDSVFAVLMAFSDKSDSQLIADMESCYTILKKDFKDGNSVQSLSHVLSLTEEAADKKCMHVSALYEELKNAGRKYGKSYELPVLGSLSLLSQDIKSLSEDILLVDAYLSNQKGYTGLLGFDKTTRLMHAAMITACDYSDKADTNTAAITQTLAMIAAEEAALCAVIAASAATTAAANN